MGGVRVFATFAIYTRRHTICFLVFAHCALDAVCIWIVSPQLCACAETSLCAGLALGQAFYISISPSSAVNTGFKLVRTLCSDKPANRTKFARVCSHDISD